MSVEAPSAHTSNKDRETAGVSVCCEGDPVEQAEGFIAESERQKRVKDDLKVFGLRN